jgi:hypothetical protein
MPTSPFIAVAAVMCFAVAGGDLIIPLRGDDIVHSDVHIIILALGNSFVVAIAGGILSPCRGDDIGAFRRSRIVAVAQRDGVAAVAELDHVAAVAGSDFVVAVP